MKPRQALTVQRAATWKRVVAPILDFFTAFFGFGMAINWLMDMAIIWLTGSVIPGGVFDIELTGVPGLVLFALIIAYFIVGRCFAGGTVWDRTLGIGRPQPRT